MDKTPGVTPADAPPRSANMLWNTISGSGFVRVVIPESRPNSIDRRPTASRPTETSSSRSATLRLPLRSRWCWIAIFEFNRLSAGRCSTPSVRRAAVGLTPQLLPAIISVNLASGARRMGEQGVIVKRLAAIENFGSMNVLCSDKTGTLTEGQARVHAALDATGNESERVLLHAFVNASYETAFGNPIDSAIRSHRIFPLDGWRKLDEVPYDFARKRLSVLAEHDGRTVLITKGALNNILDVCTFVEHTDGPIPIAAARAGIEQQYAKLSGDGYRTLGVAIREAASPGPIDRDSEHDMIFLGLLALDDPPKQGVGTAVTALAKLGVRLKMITGDNALVAARVGAQVGLTDPRVLTGSDLRTLSDDALPVIASETDVFAEVEPNQKERIIRALRKGGHVVGYMGDGINDAPALHAADISISVQEAVDVAKEAADIVLPSRTSPCWRPACAGAGRSRTLKYVFMATSANFGICSAWPALRSCCRFCRCRPADSVDNLLTDIPELTISSGSGGRRLDRTAASLGYRFHSKFMLTFRTRQLRVRLPDIRRAALAAACGTSRIPDRVVRRVRCLGDTDRARGAHTWEFPSQPAGARVVEHDVRGGRCNAGDSLHAARNGLRLRATASALSGADGNDRPGLRCERRVGETLVLQRYAPWGVLRGRTIHGFSPCAFVSGDGPAPRRRTSCARPTRARSYRDAERT